MATQPIPLKPARRLQALAAAALCLATWAAQAQPSDLDSDARFKATIDAVRQKIWPAKPGNRPVRGEKSLQNLLTRLARVDNIDQLCDQGLGSARLCATRSAQVDGDEGTDASTSMFQGLNLRQFPKGLGTVIDAALRQPAALSQSKTKANLTVPDLRAYTGTLRAQKPDARWFLRNIMNQMPLKAMEADQLAFQSTDHANMAGELLADYVDALVDTLAPGLDLCDPPEGPLIVQDKTWFSTPEAARISTCVAGVLGSDAAARHLRGLGYMLQLPSQWARQNLLKGPLPADIDQLEWFAKVLLQTEIKIIKGKTTGYSRMVAELPLKVAGIACNHSNYYCAILDPQVTDADKQHCTLGNQVPTKAQCKALPRLVLETLEKLNDPVRMWPGAFDLSRTLQGKAPRTDGFGDIVRLASNATEDFARTAQEPHSALVFKLRQTTQTGLLFDSQGWVVDAIILRP